ncbi:hypothetical protein GCM10010121_012650 [Streptomyces brasiliensis]|uniref:SDR family oxidoreductase n=1 Tax=Streptomyces brasiliensis TaxID=1954 RepID=A0A917K989_9ACTN|nr:hypothetical protein GCM10010121_012650 [Streptomyces brasiliensis]
MRPSYLTGRRKAELDAAVAAALYLAGDQSSFTTGAELFVDGGATGDAFDAPGRLSRVLATVARATVATQRHGK